MLYERDDLVLSPIAIVLTRPRTDKAAVAAVRTDRQPDPRISGHRGIVKRRWRDERVVFGGDDERRHADAIDDPHRAGSVVVVFGAEESEVRRREVFVEFPHGLHRLQFLEIEAAGPQPFFLAQP